MLLRKLVSDVEEENSRLANTNLTLEESCEQVTKSLLIWAVDFFPFRHTMLLKCIFFSFFFKVNSNILDKSNDLKQLKEQIRKVDERLDAEMQV